METGTLLFWRRAEEGVHRPLLLFDLRFSICIFCSEQKIACNRTYKLCKSTADHGVKVVLVNSDPLVVFVMEGPFKSVHVFYITVFGFPGWTGRHSFPGGLVLDLGWGWKEGLSLGRGFVLALGTGLGFGTRARICSRTGFGVWDWFPPKVGGAQSFQRTRQASACSHSYCWGVTLTRGLTFRATSSS